jgi:acyl carrier protein
MAEPAARKEVVSVNIAEAEHMIQYLKTKVLRNNDVHVDVDTPLVSSGMMDSFALVDTLMELERVTKRRIPAMKVEAEHMDTVRLMFETAIRVGKPRNA